MAKTKARTKKKSELQELSEFIRDHMVTKEYLDERLDERLNERLSPIHAILEGHTKQLADIRVELKDIRRELHELREQSARGSLLSSGLRRSCPTSRKFSAADRLYLKAISLRSQRHEPR